MKAEVQLTGTDDVITLKVGDVLKTLLGEDVLTLDENTVAEKLLFLNVTDVLYNSATFVVTKVTW